MSNSHIVTAAKEGKGSLFLELAENKCPNDLKAEFDKCGNSLLHISSKCADSEYFAISKYLLYEKDFELDQLNEENETPIHTSSSEDNSFFVHLALSKVDRSNFNDYLDVRNNEGNTALHQASKSCSYNTLLALGMHGAKYNIKNSNGQSPIDVAKSDKIKEFLDSLIKMFTLSDAIDNDWEKNFQSDISDYCTKPAELLALCFFKNAGSVTLIQKLIIKHGLTAFQSIVNALIASDGNIFNIFKKDAQENYFDNMLKSIDNHLSLITQTPFEIGAYLLKSNILITELLDFCASRWKFLEMTNKSHCDGSVMLLDPIVLIIKDVLNLIKKDSRDKKYKIKYYQNVVLIDIQFLRLTLDFLFQLVNKKLLAGKACLLIKLDKHKLFKKIIYQNESLILAKTRNNQSLLHIAVEFDSTKCASTILQLKNSCQSEDIKQLDMVNIQLTSTGNTALHICCKNENVGMVRVLLTNGAFYNALNSEGLLPRLMCHKSNHPLVRLLYRIEKFFKGVLQPPGFFTSVINAIYGGKPKWLSILIDIYEKTQYEDFVAIMSSKCIETNKVLLDLCTEYDEEFLDKFETALVRKQENRRIKMYNLVEEKLEKAKQLLDEGYFDLAAEILEELDCPQALFEQAKIYQDWADNLNTKTPEDKITDMYPLYVKLLAKARYQYYFCLSIIENENDKEKKSDESNKEFFRKQEEKSKKKLEITKLIDEVDEKLTSNQLFVDYYSSIEDLSEIRIYEPSEASTRTTRRLDHLDNVLHVTAKPEAKISDEPIQKLTEAITALTEQSTEQNHMIMEKLDQMMEIVSKLHPTATRSHSTDESQSASFSSLGVVGVEITEVTTDGNLTGTDVRNSWPKLVSTAPSSPVSLGHETNIPPNLNTQFEMYPGISFSELSAAMDRLLRQTATATVDPSSVMNINQNDLLMRIHRMSGNLSRRQLHGLLLAGFLYYYYQQLGQPLPQLQDVGSVRDDRALSFSDTKDTPLETNSAPEALSPKMPFTESEDLTKTTALTPSTECRFADGPSVKSTVDSSMLLWPSVPTAFSLPPLPMRIIKSQVTTAQVTETFSNQTVSSDLTKVKSEVLTTTGEKIAEVLFSAQAELFCLVDKKWETQGVGDVKLKIDEGKVCFMMVCEENIISATHLLEKDTELIPLPNSDTDFVWVVKDLTYKALDMTHKYWVRFETPKEATEFKDLFEFAKNNVSSDLASKEPSPSNLFSFAFQRFVKPINFVDLISRNLQKVTETYSSDEEEKEVFCQEAMYLEYDLLVQNWNERAFGYARLLINPTTEKLRLVMRREQGQEILLDHPVTSSTEMTKMNSTSFVWTIQKEDHDWKFALRFETPERAEEFKAAIFSVCKGGD